MKHPVLAGRDACCCGPGQARQPRSNSMARLCRARSGSGLCAHLAPPLTVNDGKPVRVSIRTDRAVSSFGIGRDPVRSPLRVAVTKAPDGTAAGLRLCRSRVRDYDIERIDGLPPRKVSPLIRPMWSGFYREGRLISAARARDTRTLSTRSSGFRWPMTGRISGRYGNQRILNGEAAPARISGSISLRSPGSPVAASADGSGLAGRDRICSTPAAPSCIDHGHGG